MSDNFDYIIVGGGLAGASAIDGIREHDKSGSVALFSAEKYLPYNRPPLSKGLWTGKEKFDDIFVHDGNYYKDNNVDLFSGYEIVSINPDSKTVTDIEGKSYKYGRLLIATGGEPRTLENLPEGTIRYYRQIEDYKMLREITERSERILVLGGSFMGAELAASLSVNGRKVTLVFPETYLLQRLLPEYLALNFTDYYREKGVEILNNDAIDSFSISSGETTAKTKSGRLVVCDYVVAGLGIKVNTGIAESAGLEIGNGIIVDKYLRTSNPDIYVAGDIANFPAQSLGRRIRGDHWDNAKAQGKNAGENMAGANKPYDYLPFFSSDMFDLGFEAVGELDSRLATFSQWKEPYREGVVYYFESNLLKGVLLWNVWEKADAARELISQKLRYENVEDIKDKL